MIVNSLNDVQLLIFLFLISTNRIFEQLPDTSSKVTVFKEIHMFHFALHFKQMIALLNDQSSCVFSDPDV